MSTSESLVDERGDRRVQVLPPPQRPSMIRNLVITAAVALCCGAIGAMGYLHFFTPEPGDLSSEHAKTEAGSKNGSSMPGKPAAGSTADSSTESSTGPINANSGSSREFVELKQQITNLGQRIDRLGEQVDRVQTMLSLALPLLQRIAPKS